MSGTKNQFFSTRAALSTYRRAKGKLLTASKLRIWQPRCLPAPSAFWSLFIAALCLTPDVVRADGCFVMPPFVWDKHKDINEPTQKAIIVHDGRQEDLILQVKYAGPVKDFGWLIPTPTLPTVEKASMDCLFELSRYTQQLWERGDYLAVEAGSLAAARHGAEPEPVKVIEIKTVGAYEIAVLSARTAGSLESWLKSNHFSFPRRKSEVIDSYLKGHWYFVAVKIHLTDANARRSDTSNPSATSTSVRATRHKLAQGELHPLHVRFETPQCVFPLRISSVNGRPSDVQVYVISTERLIERRMWEKQHADYRKSRARADAEMALERGPYIVGTYEPFSSLAQPELTPSLEAVGYPYAESLRYAPVTSKELPRCAKELLLSKGKTWWLSKDTWTFKPEEMEDLVFEPAIPLLEQKLAGDAGYDAGCKLLQCGPAAEKAVLEALQDPDANRRIAVAASIVRTSDNAKLLGSVADRLDDLRPEVRMLAEDAVFKLCLYGWDAERHIPRLMQMLVKEPQAVRLAAFELLVRLQADIPREEAASFFKVPDEKTVTLAYSYLRTENLSCDEAASLLSNSLPFARCLGLNFLKQVRNSRAVELAMPLLRDPDERVRTTANRVMQSLTGQHFAGNHPEKWEHWWAANKSNFRPSEDR